MITLNNRLKIKKAKIRVGRGIGSGKGQELHITDAIRSLIKKKEKFIAHSFSGKYLDCGTMDGYIKSSMEISKL